MTRFGAESGAQRAESEGRSAKGGVPAPLASFARSSPLYGIWLMARELRSLYGEWHIAYG